MRQPAVALALLALLLASAAAADAPPAMAVAGTLRVNGILAAEGTEVHLVAANATVASGRVDAAGGFRFEAAADDPDTPAREGLREGEPLAFRAAGGLARPPNATFAANATLALEVDVQVPDLVLANAAVVTREPREGDPMVVLVLVENRGLADAQDVVVSVMNSGRHLGAARVGDVPVNTSRTERVTVDVAGLGGPRVFQAVVVGGNGEADPASNVRPLNAYVAPNGGPVASAFARAPEQPVAGANVTLALEARDPDGVAGVRFLWVVGELAGATPSAFDAAAPPYAATIGPFAAGEVVRYWAVLTDASVPPRTSTTAAETFTVAPAADAAGDPARAPWSAGLAALAAVGAALGVAIYAWQRRRA